MRALRWQLVSQQFPRGGGDLRGTIKCFQTKHRRKPVALLAVKNFLAKAKHHVTNCPGPVKPDLFCFYFFWGFFFFFFLEISDFAFATFHFYISSEVKQQMSFGVFFRSLRPTLWKTFFSLSVCVHTFPHSLLVLPPSCYSLLLKRLDNHI